MNTGGTGLNGVSKGLADGSYVGYVTGLVSDGATDNTAKLRAALDAANTAGGGTVNIPAGTFLTGPLVQYANVVIAGAGRANTVLKLNAGANADLLTISNFGTLTGGTSNGPSGFGLRNITLDANRANQTARARCWVVYGYNYIVDNVWFINGYGGGVYSEWGGNDNPMESFWADVKVWNYGGTPGCVGLDWNGPHDSKFENVIIATLDSTIKQTDATYGATPINGSAVNFPGNGVPFTFVTTAAADPAVFPTSGGSFVVKTQNSLETWVLVTYTSAATVGAVTTFSGCNANIGSNRTVVPSDGIAQPTYGLRINGGSGTHGETGLHAGKIHIWGRNHFGLFPATASSAFFAGNAECEGAFIANVIMSNNSYYRGAVYGTNGQAGQTNESGVQIGTHAVGCGRSQVDAVVYNVGGSSSANGCSVTVANSSGGNQIRVTGSTQHPSKYVALYSGSPDLWEAHCNNVAFNAVQHPANPVETRDTPTYGATVTFKPVVGKWHTVTVTNSTAFAIVFTNVIGATQEFTAEVYNNSGGAMGAITWPGNIAWAGFTWANPATGKKRYANFRWNGSAWVCMSMASADY